MSYPLPAFSSDHKVLGCLPVATCVALVVGGTSVAAVGYLAFKVLGMSAIIKIAAAVPVAIASIFALGAVVYVGIGIGILGLVMCALAFGRPVVHTC